MELKVREVFEDEKTSSFRKLWGRKQDRTEPTGMISIQVRMQPNKEQENENVCVDSTLYSIFKD